MEIKPGTTNCILRPEESQALGLASTRFPTSGFSTGDVYPLEFINDLVGDVLDTYPSRRTECEANMRSPLVSEAGRARDTFLALERQLKLVENMAVVILAHEISVL